MKNNSQIDLTLPKCSCFLPLGWKCWNQLPCIPSLPFSKKKHGEWAQNRKECSQAGSSKLFQQKHGRKMNKKRILKQSFCKSNSWGKAESTINYVILNKQADWYILPGRHPFSHLDTWHTSLSFPEEEGSYTWAHYYTFCHPWGEVLFLIGRLNILMLWRQSDKLVNDCPHWSFPKRETFSYFVKYFTIKKKRKKSQH